MEHQTLTTEQDTDGVNTLESNEIEKRRDSIAKTILRRKTEHEKNCTVRTCLNCNQEFQSAGIHNRLCGRCQKRA